jgi:hypothetical protein
MADIKASMLCPRLYFFNVLYRRTSFILSLTAAKSSPNKLRRGTTLHSKARIRVTDTEQKGQEDFKMPDFAAKSEYQRLCERVAELRHNHIALPTVKSQARIRLENKLEHVLEVREIPNASLSIPMLIHASIR